MFIPSHFERFAIDIDEIVDPFVINLHIGENYFINSLSVISPLHFCEKLFKCSWNQTCILVCSSFDREGFS